MDQTRSSNTLDFLIDSFLHAICFAVLAEMPRGAPHHTQTSNLHSPRGVDKGTIVTRPRQIQTGGQVNWPFNTLFLVNKRVKRWVLLDVFERRFYSFRTTRFVLSH